MTIKNVVKMCSMKTQKSASKYMNNKTQKTEVYVLIYKNT